MTETHILALTGPPAGGKSTVCDLFEDIDVPTIGTGDGVRERAHERYDDPDEDDIWDTAQFLRDEHGPAGPTIACEDLIKEHTRLEPKPLVVVSDLREQAEVDWLREEFGPVLVVRVDTRSSSERMQRYVDREIGNLGENEPVPADRRQELTEEMNRRELRESPYPNHQLTLLNDNAVHMDELMCRIEGICRFLDPDGEYEFGMGCY